MSDKLVAKLKGNRKWTEDANGSITSLTRRYQIIRPDIPEGSADEEVVSTDVDGLPQKQSSHSNTHPNLKCDGYFWEEGSDSGKRVLYCDVHYSVWQSEVSEANRPPRGQAVEQFGWRSGSVSRDLVRDAGTGAILLNTAGQPFDSVPQVDIPAPTFTKVVKTTERQQWEAFQGKINSAQIIIGGVTCGIHCLRCVQMDEERLWNDDFGYKYKYTIGLQLMSNEAVIGAAEQAVDIGWDLAVVSCGTMEKKTPDSKATPVSSRSSTTGSEVFVSSPVLLDGEGKAMLEPGATPFAVRVQAYKAAAFPEDFYSEPGEEESHENQPERPAV